MTDTKLYIGNKTYSSWSLRGWLACKHANLSFEEILMPLDTDEFRHTMRAASPTGCVPLLCHGETKVWDSLAIIDYVDHITDGVSLWPDDRAAYGEAKSLCAEMHSGLTHLRGACPMNFRRKWTGLEMTKKVARDVTRVDSIWTETREKYGAGGNFLFGAFGAADIMFAPVVGRFDTYDLPRSAVSQAYMDAVFNHPLMKEWLAGAAEEAMIVAVDEIDPDTTVLGE